MLLDEYNNVLDEVHAMREFAHAMLDEAERMRKEVITKAREFIKEKTGEDALVSISSVLYQIEASEKLKEVTR